MKFVVFRQKFVGYYCYAQLVKRAPPFIPQQVRGNIKAEQNKDLLSRDCVRLASMMPRNCRGSKGGARFTNFVILKLEDRARD
jgi:hypothetical protein